MALMGKKVEPERRRTSPAGLTDVMAGGAGFTLLEMVCVVAIVAMLAAIVLPAFPRGTSRTRLEAYAIETARLLKDDRNAAIRRRVQIAARVDVTSRRVQSGSTGRIVRIPDDIVVSAMLAAACNQRLAGKTIDFFASGMSCGGTIALTRRGIGYQIRVNWLTGGVEIVPVDAP
jgi:general secretion pathway protein H